MVRVVAVATFYLGCMLNDHKLEDHLGEILDKTSVEGAVNDLTLFGSVGLITQVILVALATEDDLAAKHIGANVEQPGELPVSLLRHIFFILDLKNLIQKHLSARDDPAKSSDCPEEHEISGK